MDLIDRQAAIDAIWEHATRILENSDYDVFIQDIYKMTHRHIAELIAQLPSAQPEQRWIPVETKMPKKGTLVLITDKDGYIFIAEWFKTGFSWEKHIEWWAEDEEVFPTAWMPLPEPYTERSNDGS